MKTKLTILFFFLNMSVVTMANLYMCKNDDCRTVIIEDSGGFAWSVTCKDGLSESGYTSGAGYGGSCALLLIE